MSKDQQYYAYSAWLIKLNYIYLLNHVYGEVSFIKQQHHV